MAAQLIGCGDATLSGDELRTRAAQVAAGLAELAVGPGDRVAVLLRNSLEFIEIAMGAGRLGAYLVPINWHLTSSEVEFLIEDCSPKVVFAHAGIAGSLDRGSAGAVTILVEDGVPPPAGREGLPRYAGWRDGHAPSTAAPRPAPGSMVYTSGTTGRPKGVARAVSSPEDAARMQSVRRRLYRLDGASRVVGSGPLYHAFPFQLAMCAVQEAAYLHVSPRFDPETFLALVERERITVAGLAPIMFVRLLRLPQSVRDRYDTSSLQWVLHAGGPCAPEIKRAMIDWWGPVLGEYYGGTETGPLTLSDSQDWLSHPGSCGRPLPEATLRIVDETGRDAPVGQPGEIYGRLWPYPDFTYHNDPQMRASVALGDLVSLGDVGYLDADSYLYLCDRARDMIVSGAVNIYPAEIEAALFTLPGIEDCAVFGVPDEEFGESVVGFVCGRDLDADALRSRLRELIAGYKVPRRLMIVETLGRDASGKLRKTALRDRYLAVRQGRDR